MPKLFEPHGQPYTPMAFASDPNAIFTVRTGVPDLVLELQEAMDDEGSVAFTVEYFCEAIILGCMDPTATNYNPTASVDDEACTYAATTCTADGTASCNGYSCTATPFGGNECACFRQATGVGKRSRPDTWNTGPDGAMWAAGSDPFEVVTATMAAQPCEDVSSSGLSASSAFRQAVNADTTGGVYWLKFSSAVTARTDRLLPVGASFVVEGLLPAGYDLADPDYQLLPVWNGAMLTCNHYARCLYRRLAIKDMWSSSNAAVAVAFNGGTMVFHDVLMQDNMAFAFHACAWCHTGTICDLVRIAVIGNVAHENAGVGGWGAISLRNSTIRDNWALRGAGLMFNRARENRPCSDAKADCSASGLYICNAGQCEPKFVMENSEVVNNTAFGDFGGALAVGGSGLDVTISAKDSTFNGNVAAVGGDTFYKTALNDPAESRGFAVTGCTVEQPRSTGTVAYLREQASWKFLNLNIQTWQPDMLYTEGDGLGGCAAFTDDTPACSLGEECFDDAGSAWCTPCLSPTQISGGMRCVECDRSQIPSDDRSRCVACPAGTYGAGAACTICESGRYSAGEASECTFCPSGSEPDVGAMLAPDTHEGAVGCSQCDAGSYSAFGISCVVCEAPSIVPPGQSSCFRCGIGMGPTVDSTACALCEGNFYSKGGACVACPVGTATNSLKTKCNDYSELEVAITEILVIDNIMNESRRLLSRVQDDHTGTVSKTVVVRATVSLPLDALAALQEDGALGGLTDYLALPPDAFSLNILSGAVGTGRRQLQAAAAAAGDALWLELSILDPALEQQKILAFDALATCVRTPTSHGCDAGAIATAMSISSPGLQFLAGVPAYTIACPPGTFRSRGEPLCKFCPYNAIPAMDYTVRRFVELHNPLCEKILLLPCSGVLVLLLSALRERRENTALVPNARSEKCRRSPMVS